MRVITFSRYFPAKHPRKGEQTYFIEKIWAGLADKTDMVQGNVEMDWYEYYNGVPKWHTIRAGNRWKVDDWFSPRFWSGKPYASKQSLITEPIQIKKIWTFDILNFEEVICFRINGSPMGQLHPFNERLKELAKNDGLTAIEFIQWFNCHPKLMKDGFHGQILCWNEQIEYL